MKGNDKIAASAFWFFLLYSSLSSKKEEKKRTSFWALCVYVFYLNERMRPHHNTCTLPLSLILWAVYFWSRVVVEFIFFKLNKRRITEENSEKKTEKLKWKHSDSIWFVRIFFFLNIFFRIAIIIWTRIKWWWWTTCALNFVMKFELWPKFLELLVLPLSFEDGNNREKIKIQRGGKYPKNAVF